ncbi:MAG: type II toxin-antitoxin system HicA family toxin [Acidobacteriota bacterium]
MVFKQCRMTVPSNSEYSVPQLRMMLREVEEIIERKITVEEWNGLP